ncbi:MAG: hypothetical protein K0U93_19855, partial [Gammaproteobacteria bacterium]|nr:hypothetical protein [Gammaproteobacteria bacterium]
INHPSTGHATVAALRADGPERAMKISPFAYPDHRFPTPSGKVEFASAQAAALGLPSLPVFSPQSAPNEEFPLRFRQGRTLTHFHSFYDEGRALPTLKKRSGKATLWISPRDARPRGIVDGAEIGIRNQRGDFCAWAEITDKVPPGTVWMRDGWVGINDVTSDEACLPDSAVDLFPFSVGQSAFDAWVEVTTR